MLNNVVLIGRLVERPDLRYTQNGNPVSKFTLAVDRTHTSQGGGKKTDFIDVVCWRKLAEIVANNLDKGRLVAVKGRIQTNTYKDKQGNTRKGWEILADNVRFLDWPKDRQSSQDDYGDDYGGNYNDLSDDDVPF